MLFLRNDAHQARSRRSDFMSDNRRLCDCAGSEAEDVACDVFYNLIKLSGCSAVGSARALGARCRRFESCHSDQKKTVILIQNCSHFFIHYGVMVYQPATCLRAYHQKERFSSLFFAYHHVLTCIKTP